MSFLYLTSYCWWLRSCMGWYCRDWWWASKFRSYPGTNLTCSTDCVRGDNFYINGYVHKKNRQWNGENCDQDKYVKQLNFFSKWSDCCVYIITNYCTEVSNYQNDFQRAKFCRFRGESLGMVVVSGENPCENLGCRWNENPRGNSGEIFKSGLKWEGSFPKSVNILIHQRMTSTTIHTLGKISVFFLPWAKQQLALILPANMVSLFSE